MNCCFNAVNIQQTSILCPVQCGSVYQCQVFIDCCLYVPVLRQAFNKLKIYSWDWSQDVSSGIIKLQRKTTILFKVFQLRHSVKTIPSLASLSRSQAERLDDKGSSERLLRACPSPGPRPLRRLHCPLRWSKLRLLPNPFLEAIPMLPSTQQQPGLPVCCQQPSPGKFHRKTAVCPAHQLLLLSHMLTTDWIVISGLACPLVFGPPKTSASPGIPGSYWSLWEMSSQHDGPRQQQKAITHGTVQRDRRGQGSMSNSRIRSCILVEE